MFEIHTDHYLPSAIILLISRFFDLLSTWFITPTFALELNQWMKTIGWRNTIIINLLLILLIPLLMGPHSAVMLAVFGAIIAWRNFLLYPMASVLGEGEYLRLVREYRVTTSPVRFRIIVISKFSITVLLGFFILAVGAIDHDKKLWFIPDIARGFMFSGFFLAIMETVLRRSELKSVDKMRTKNITH
jgi:hypothetical protein